MTAADGGPNDGMSGFEIISLKEWYEGDISSEDAVVNRLPIVDIRESHEAGRLKHDDDTMLVVHLPLSTLLSGERSCELPPRHVPFAVLIHEDVMDSAREFFGATISKATQQSRKPWLIPQVLLANDTLWKEARELGILQVENGKASKGDDVFQPQSRLWQPDPMIMSVLWPLLRELPPSTSPHSEEVWDLGSGAGRDACFLAEHAKALGMNHYRFVGIDNHKGSMKRCLPFWKHRHVDNYTEARNMNLNKIDCVREEMKGRSIVCLYAVRFWNAKMVTFIANDAELLSGTLFAMSHFCKPYPGAPWDFDHPKVQSNVLVIFVRCDLVRLFLTQQKSAIDRKRVCWIGMSCAPCLKSRNGGKFCMMNWLKIVIMVVP